MRGSIRFMINVTSNATTHPHAPSSASLRVLIIIPAYNEARNIISTVTDIRKSTDYDYLVINDGSTDNTLAVCIEHDIPYLNLFINLGIGGAVQAGYKYAHEQGYDICIQFDGDGQHDAAYLDDLVAVIENDGVNLAIGSRFIEGAPAAFKSTRVRRLGISWLSFIIKAFAGVRITDPTSGFRAADRKVISLFCAQYPTDYPEPESVVTVFAHSLNVKEIPVAMRERRSGSSSIGSLSSLYYMLKVSLAVIIQSKHRKKKKVM